MSLLVLVPLTGVMRWSADFNKLGEVRVEVRGDSGTLKVPRRSANPHFRGDGDHVTLFFGVFEMGLLRRCGPEEVGQSSEALTGVRRMPFRGLLPGLSFVGVSTTRVFLAGDLERSMLSCRELPASGLCATEETLILDGGGVWGEIGVRGVLGGVIPCVVLPRLLGDLVGVLFGL